MSLRTRLAAIVALAVLLVSTLVILSARELAERELEQNVDNELRQAIATVASDLRPREGGRGNRRDNRLESRRWFAQIVDRDGTIINNADDAPLLVFTADDAALFDRPLIKDRDGLDGSRIRFANVDLDGDTYRVATRAFPRGAVQVAINRGGIDTTVAGLTDRLWILVAFGALISALVGYLVANRIARPIERLASTATGVAKTRDFGQRIEVDRNDEVGKLANSFNSMLGALEVSQEQQHRLVQDASHELRTPLTSLRTNIDLLSARGDAIPADQRNEIVADLKRESQELTNLVGELVDLATDQDAAAASPIEFDLGAVTNDIATRFGRLEDRAITVQGDHQLVVADIEAIERSIVNLVTNAVKFSPAGSAIEVVLSTDAGLHRVEVHDQGSGIPAGDEERIFDRFYRSDETRTLPGSGLGLSIVAQTAERHGGSAWAANRSPGPGALVGFSFSSLS